VNAAGSDDRLRALEREAHRHQGLMLLVLYGSRARGGFRLDSDWDLGYLAEGRFDPDAFLAEAVRALESDSIDLVDLARASGQLRYRAAAEAIVVFDRTGEAFARFWLDAVDFWCDAAPVLQAGYDEVLMDIAR
jgi:predicted nucleotidyltransferase